MKICSVIKHAAAAVLFAAAALALASCGSIQINAENRAGLVINEAVSSNGRCLIDEEAGTPDWVEIYNGGSTSVNLTGYGLSDNIREPHKWTFPDISLAPGETLLVYAADPVPGSSMEQLSTGFGLSKSGETLFLTDKYYNMLHQLSLPPLSADISWARRSDGTFGYCASPTPGAVNDDKAIAGSMDDLVYTANPGALAITEVMPGNTCGLKSADGRFYAWAEILNISDEPVNLSGYWLSDNDGNFMKWRLTEGTLAPGEYLIVYFSGLTKNAPKDETHAPFRIGSGDTGVYLCDSQGVLRSQLTWDAGIPANLSVVSDSGDRYTAFATPGTANSDKRFSSAQLSGMNDQDPIRISEFLPRNQFGLMDGDGDRESWVELYNSSSSPVSLLGYFVSDDALEPLKWALPDITLAADEYALVFLSGKSRVDSEMHASFRIARDDSVFMLICADGMRADTIDIPSAIGQDISIAPDAEGGQIYFAYPTPGAPNTSVSFPSVDLVSAVDTQGVYISEVCGAQAAKSGKTDWIELYNGGDQDVSLAGWYLSDDAREPLKWKIPSLTVKAKGHALVYADADNSDSGRLTAPFSISSSGERLILSCPQGFTRDVFETGVMRASVSSGRLEGDASGQRLFFTSPTPGAKNTSAGLNGYAAKPRLSHTGLYASDPFTLSITCDTPGAKIYYTLDGSKPTSSSHLYTGPIKITGNTPVRAVAVAQGMLESDVSTATYLFEREHTVPVVCLTGNPSSISEVYAVTDRWKKLERESFVEFYEADGRLGVSFPAGVRVNGAGTLVERQKGLALLLRGGYGQNQVTYPFFKDFDINSFKSLVLRASGQDMRKARIRDAFFSRAVNGMNIDNAQTRLCVLYINGEYWGIYDLMENQNEDYLASHYGVSANSANIIRRNQTALEGTNAEIKRVRAYALNTDLSDETKYLEFMEWVDEEFFIDYLAAQSYFANGDMFNQKYWRTDDYTIKWRPIFYDLDLGMSGNNPRSSVLNRYFTLEGVPSRDGSLTNMDIYIGLMKNRGWRERFSQRYAYLIFNQFAPERLTAILDEMADEMQPELDRHIQRWGHPSSVSAWEVQIAALRKCLENRQEFALSQIQNVFGWSHEQMDEFIQKARRQ